jgi:phosphate transport system permease protein
MSSSQQTHSGFIAINLSASAAAILSLSLLSILIYILVKGSSYFAFYPTVAVHWEPPSGKSQVEFAQQYYSDPAASEVTLLLYDSAKQRNQQVSIKHTDISIKQPAADVWTLYLHNGNLVFGQRLSLSMPVEDVVEVLPYSAANFAATTHAIEQLQEQRRSVVSALAPLHIKYAELKRINISADTPILERLIQKIEVQQLTLQQLDRQLALYRLNFELADGQVDSFALYNVDYILNTNSLSWLERVSFGALKIWQFLSDTPKQANSTGGVFPALFGTLLLVFLMTIMVLPLGVLTALYLHEYAGNNGLTIVLRTIITNLAGIPSIVFGVFGLGLFVFVMGTSLDEWFYMGRLPTPTFGTPGILWAALTMALLTLPVVIVATEEGLRQVPDGLKKGAMALGATKYEMIRNIVLPIASPSIVTGGILAIARAAGEVAPLLLVGAVMYAPNLPVDATFPYIHLERQFMHLGVLVFDGVFHSQNNINASSMMFATCLLLIMIVLVLNSLASWLRFKLKKQYDWQSN